MAAAADSTESPSDAEAFQRAAQRRDALIANERWLSTKALANRLQGSVPASNANQFANHLRQAGEILGVRHGRTRIHPECQFRAVEGRLEPLPVVRTLLELLPKDDSGWTQVFWLFQPTGRLQGACPAEVLANRPDDVLLAAEKDFRGDDGI